MPISDDLLQVSSHDGPGYVPMVDFGAWRVALMNLCDECAPGGVARMERHNETDEVFVLLEGRAILFVGEAGEGSAAVDRIHPCAMERSKLYNVRRSAWHACALSADAKVLIVENRDTAEANSDYVTLGDAQRAQVAREAAVLDG
ncbi:MAG: hypothetical protein ACYS9X_16145 [Planctomycetota bacterium]|jgi:hypothetical protein